MRELTFRIQKKQSNNNSDQLMVYLKRMFGSKDDIDIELFQSQANHHLSSSSSIPTVSTEALKAVAQQGSVESFSLVHSVPSNQFTSINIYLDEVGMLKRLPINKRIGQYASLAGFHPPPTFYGDVFIGRVKVRTHTHTHYKLIYIYLFFYWIFLKKTHSFILSLY